MTRSPRRRLAVARALVVFFAALALATTSPALAEPAGRAMGEGWPQWRGPERDGSVAGDGWPDDLRGLEPAWRVELGPSYSGPIVAADRVFTTETRAEAEEVVTAFDRRTGERLWQARWPGAVKVPFFAAKNGSWIRSTPAWDGETLFVGGIREVLVALDGDTGEERWRLDFPARFGTPVPPFGFVCSPLVTEDALFVEAARSVFRLDKASGVVVWRAGPFGDGEMSDEGTFSSPVLTRLAGREQLLVQGRQQLRGFDPATGEVLWTQDVPSFRGMNILTPAPWGDAAVFTSTHRHGSWLYRLRTTGDPASPFEVETVWESKVQGYMSSPVVLGDTAYLHLGNGRLTALARDDGEPRWTSKPFGKYWSMAVQGGRLLALDSGGELLLVEADPEALKVLDRRQVADAETWAHVAVAGDQVFVRELNALAAWRWRPAPAESAATPRR